MFGPVCFLVTLPPFLSGRVTGQLHARLPRLHRQLRGKHAERWENHGRQLSTFDRGSSLGRAANVVLTHKVGFGKVSVPSIVQRDNSRVPTRARLLSVDGDRSAVSCDRVGSPFTV
jgi:hypothetical protein